MKDSKDTTRRSLIKGISGAIPAVGLTMATGIGNAQSNNKSKFVSVDEAKSVAEQMVSHFARTDSEVESWQDGILNDPTKYYTLTSDGGYDPAAYVFQVVNQDNSNENLGYITIAARRSWSPVLEYSTNEPPTAGRERAKKTAQTMGDSPTGRLLYQGGLNYGIHLGGQEMIHLGHNKKMVAHAKSDILSYDEGDEVVDTQAQWEGAADPSVEGTGVSIMASSGSGRVGFSDYAWDAHVGEGVSGSDSGNDVGDGDDCNGCVGLADDPWQDWDGCIPIAGTQVVMYHEGLENEWSNRQEREKICDELHMGMDTGQDISTSFKNIPGGFTSLDLSFLDNDYDANQELLISKGLFTSDIDDDKPLMLNRPGDACGLGICIESSEDVTISDKEKGDYDNHTVVVAGYQDGGDKLEVFSGWNTNRHTISYGNWGYRAQVTRVWTT